MFFGNCEIEYTSSPSFESTHILPPCKSIIFSQWDRPIPVPSYWFSVVKTSENLENFAYVFLIDTNAIILDRNANIIYLFSIYINFRNASCLVNFKELLIKFCNTSLISVGYPLISHLLMVIWAFFYNHWHIRENLIKNFTAINCS
jgi:hypothetical protein